jgi:hypothetical protein
LIEDGYEVRNFANYYVASQNIGWLTQPSAYDSYFQNLNSSTTPDALASTIVNDYADFMEQWPWGAPAYTMSVADLSQIDTLAQAVNTLASILSADMQQYASSIGTARSAAQKFDSNGSDDITDEDNYIDIYDFAQQLNSQVSSTDVQTATQAVMDAVEDYIIAERHASGPVYNATVTMDGAHGVGIFFPSQASSYYQATEYQFAIGANWSGNRALAQTDGSTWGAMLVSYFNETQPDGEVVTDPPDAVEGILRQSESSVYLPLVIR